MRAATILSIPWIASAFAQEALPPAPEAPAVVFCNPTAISDGGRLSEADAAYFKGRGDAGDSYAAFRLGVHYASLEDAIESARWEDRAAELGHPIAQYNLWFRHRDARNCPDSREALSWLERAAQSGEADAITHLPAYRAQVRMQCAGGQ